VLYCLAAVIIGVGAAGIVDSIRHPGVPVPGPTAPTTSWVAQLTKPFAGIDRLHILLVGTDDLKEHGRSDTIMVLFLNPQLNRAALLSLPRDLRVEIPGHGTDKINHAYFFGGVELTRQTVERVLGLNIDYYAKADFQAFEKIVDMLGGVDIEVPFRMDKHTYYGDIDLQPGYQHLNGEQALDFVRYREDNDFKRAERQQQFLRAVVQQKLRLSKVHRLIKAGSFIAQTVDTDMEWPTPIQLARVLKEVPASEIMTAVMPARDAPRNGIYYAELRERRFFELMDDIDDHLDQRAGHPITVEILNGFGEPGAAATAGELLADAGFEVTETANADNFDYQLTVSNYKPALQNGARQAKKVLRLAKAEMIENQPGGSWESPELVIVLGQDFEDAQDSVQ